MAINYTWDVKKCDVHPSKSGKSNVVHNVHWRLKATDDSNNDSNGRPLTVEIYGSQGLDISDLSNFTNWSSLDTAKVQSWVEAALETEEADSVAAMKAGLDADIARQITPTTVQKTLG